MIGPQGAKAGIGEVASSFKAVEEGQKDGTGPLALKGNMEPAVCRASLSLRFHLRGEPAELIGPMFDGGWDRD
jgi:hypothetical protein